MNEIQRAFFRFEQAKDPETKLMLCHGYLLLLHARRIRWLSFVIFIQTILIILLILGKL